VHPNLVWLSAAPPWNGSKLSFKRGKRLDRSRNDFDAVVPRHHDERCPKIWESCLGVPLEKCPRRSSKPTENTGRLRKDALYIAQSYRCSTRTPAEVTAEPRRMRRSFNSTAIETIPTGHGTGCCASWDSPQLARREARTQGYVIRGS